MMTTTSNNGAVMALVKQFFNNINPIEWLRRWCTCTTTKDVHTESNVVDPANNREVKEVRVNNLTDLPDAAKRLFELGDCVEGRELLNRVTSLMSLEDAPCVLRWLLEYNDSALLDAWCWSELEDALASWGWRFATAKEWRDQKYGRTYCQVTYHTPVGRTVIVRHHGVREGRHDIVRDGERVMVLKHQHLPDPYRTLRDGDIVIVRCELHPLDRPTWRMRENPNLR